MQVTKRLVALTLSSALLLGAACADDDPASPSGPTVTQVAGTYQATTFTATSALGSEDVLQSGGSLTAAFNLDGSLTGHVVVPSESLDEDFSGEWTISDGEVEIEEVPTDIFFEDLNFNVVGSTLVADETLSGVRVQVTLTKQ